MSSRQEVKGAVVLECICSETICIVHERMAPTLTGTGEISAVVITLAGVGAVVVTLAGVGAVVVTLAGVGAVVVTLAGVGAIVVTLVGVCTVGLTMVWLHAVARALVILTQHTTTAEQSKSKR